MGRERSTLKNLTRNRLGPARCRLKMRPKVSSVHVERHQKVVSAYTPYTNNTTAKHMHGGVRPGMFWTPSNVFVEVVVGDVSLYHSFSHLRSLLGAYLICMSSPTQNCLEKSLVAEAAWRAQRAFRTPTPTRTASHITGIGQLLRHHE